MTPHLNLLPLSYRRRALLRSRLLRWSIVWVVTFGLAAIVCLWQYQDVASMRRHSKTLRRQCMPLRRLERESERMQNRLGELTDRKSLLAALRTSRSPFQLIAVVSQSTGDSETGICVRQFELSVARQRRPNTTPAEKGAKADNSQSDQDEGPRMLLRLQGNATDDVAIAQFVKSLRDSSAFEAVRLKSAASTQLLGRDVREYEIDCTF
jgi:hypothetical protein